MRTPRIYGLSAPLPFYDRGIPVVKWDGRPQPSYATATPTDSTYEARRNGVYLGASWYASVMLGYPKYVAIHSDLESVIRQPYTTPTSIAAGAAGAGLYYTFVASFINGVEAAMEYRTSVTTQTGYTLSRSDITTLARNEAERQWQAAQRPASPYRLAPPGPSSPPRGY